MSRSVLVAVSLKCLETSHEELVHQGPNELKKLLLIIRVQTRLSGTNTCIHTYYIFKMKTGNKANNKMAFIKCICRTKLMLAVGYVF